MMRYALLALTLGMCRADAPGAPDIDVPVRLASAGVVRSVVVKPDTMFLNVADVGQATCTVYGNQNTVLKYGCGWKSLDTAVAKVTTASGTTTGVTAKKVGVARVVATVKGKADTARALVTATTALPKITRYVIAPKAFSVDTFHSQQLCAFMGFASGHLAERAIEKGVPTCDSLYQLHSMAERSVTPDEQRAADLECVQWDATGGTIVAEPCGSSS